jgi:hypothetical protein
MIMGFYDLPTLNWDRPDLDGKWSPAEVNHVLFRNFENPEQAMLELATQTPGVTFSDQTHISLPELLQSQE